jgi:hypothetical protein
MSDFEVKSPRKLKYACGLAEGKTKKQAALDAGYSLSVAKTAKAHIETRDVLEALQRKIRERIPIDRIVERLSEGLDAVETKFFCKNGLATEMRQVTDWAERREYIKLIAKYGGYFIEGAEVRENADDSSDDPAENLRAIFRQAIARAAEAQRREGSETTQPTVESVADTTNATRSK